MNGLKGIYEADFNEIKKCIEKEAAPGTQRDEAIESLLTIYLEAQENSAELSEIRGESAKDYAKEICESLPKKKKANKNLIFAVLGIFTVAAIVLGIMALTKPEEPIDIVRTENYNIYGEKVAYLYDDEIMLDVTFENTGNTTLYLSFDTEIWHYSNGRWDLWLNEENYSGGMQAVLPWETTNFFGTFDLAGKLSGMVYDDCLFKIKREVFRYSDSEIKESIGFAEWIFDIESYDGIVAIGEIGSGFIPDQSGMPKDYVFANEEQAEYVEKLIDEINWERIINFAAVSYPNDVNFHVEIPRNEAIKIIHQLQEMELVACEPKNPNTGGGYSFYIETFDENIAIATNGGFFEIWIEGEASAYIFDETAECSEIFGTMWNIAGGFLEMEYNNMYPQYPESDEGEINPQPGYATETEEAHWIIPQDVDVRGTLFSNKEKISVNSLFFEDLRIILKEENFDKDKIENADLFLGEPFYPVDTVEFVRNDTGKKYVINIFENGFSLSGSAFTDEEKDAIYFAYDDTWEKFKNKIQKEFDEATEYNAYWLGLIHEKNISEIGIRYGENSCVFFPESESFENFVTCLRYFDVLSPAQRFEGKELPSGNGKYVTITVSFNTGTKYEILVTETEISIVSSDMSYGLTYKLPENSLGYDEFTDYAFGGPINAVTGTG